MSNEILRLEAVAKSFVAGETETVILKQIDFRLDRGATAAVIGPSGSGKSTLLNIIGALDKPSSGRVQLDGQDLLALGERELAAVRNRKIGFVFQLHHLLPQCSILENVLVPTLAADPGGAASPDGEKPEERARRLLDRVGLSPRLGHRPGQLSGGERQRAAVVRALINRPLLLLADEPTGSLDRAGADNLCRLLAELNKEEGVTLLMVTHSMRLAAALDRVYELMDGTLKPRENVSGD